jgi:hypothetical protein
MEVPSMSYTDPAAHSTCFSPACRAHTNFLPLGTTDCVDAMPDGGLRPQAPVVDPPVDYTFLDTNPYDGLYPVGV